ncbi:MAG: response regulator [Candidatus Tectomicrobia bacterium]|nr:response regulator [Candidatus Tectomicrobia bacterium]
MMNIRRVLIIDNEQTVLDVLEAILKLLGYDAVKAHSGEESLIIFKKEKVDAVITDIVMADFHGISVLKEIKREAPYLPVFVMTGYGAELADEAMKAGAQGTLLKPFTVSQVKALIESIEKG